MKVTVDVEDNFAVQIELDTAYNTDALDDMVARARRLFGEVLAEVGGWDKVAGLDE